MTGYSSKEIIRIVKIRPERDRQGRPCARTASVALFWLKLSIIAVTKVNAENLTSACEKAPADNRPCLLNIVATISHFVVPE